MFFNKAKKTGGELPRIGFKTVSPLYGTDEFNNAVRFAEYEISQAKDKQSKLEVLDYIIKAVKIDLQTDLLSAIIYSGNDLKEMHPLFPHTFYDEKGNGFSIYRSEEKVKVDLSKVCTLALPWDWSRYVNSLLHIKHVDFEFHSDNHFSDYYTLVDICCVTNGNHSISAGVSYGKGEIISKTCHTELLFTHVCTDGNCWYNTHTEAKLDKVWDFRTAIIYELAKMRYNLENGNS